MKRLTILLTIILITSLFICGCDENTDSLTDDETDTETREEPDPIVIYLDNRAGWDMVYCIAVIERDGAEHVKLLMNTDDYGIHCAEVPGDCSGILFSNGEGVQTSVLTPPHAVERTYDNLANVWKLYDDAIANSLVLGDNTVRVTPAHKDKGCEYILFHAENDGIYTFTSPSEFNIKIVTIEWNEGSWEADSPDWNVFFGTGNTAELKAGYYYVCLDNSHRSVYEGIHKVCVEYTKPVPNPYPLVNNIFYDGEITVLFIENSGHVMSIVDSEMNTYMYYYTAVKTDDGYMLNLEVKEGSEEYIVNGYSLSALCGGENVYVSDGYLYFYKHKIPSMEAKNK